MLHSCVQQASYDLTVCIHLLWTQGLIGKRSEVHLVLARSCPFAPSQAPSKPGCFCHISSITVGLLLLIRGSQGSPSACMRNCLICPITGYSFPLPQPQHISRRSATPPDIFFRCCPISRQYQVLSSLSRCRVFT